MENQKKHWYDFIASDKILYIMPWLFILSIIVYDTVLLRSAENIDLIQSGSVSISTLIVDVMNILCVIGITLSFYTHKKNVMKTLLGTVFMVRIIYAFIIFTIYTVEITSDALYTIWSIIYLILCILFFANHIILGLGHNARKYGISTGMIIAILICCSDLVLLIKSTDLFYVFILIISVIADLTITSIILCIEAKVNAFKEIRDEKRLEASK